MNAKSAQLALFALFMALCQAKPAEPEKGLLPPVESTLVGQPKQLDKDKKPPEKKLTDAPDTDIFAQGPPMGSEFATGFNPHMMGDLFGYFARVRINVLGTQTTTTTTGRLGAVPPFGAVTTTTTTPVTQSKIILVPVASLGAFKVAENESPRPIDRVFVTGNYFGHLAGPDISSASSSTANTLTTIPNPRLGPTIVKTTTDTVVPGGPRVTADLYREVFGFEKTFLGGNASVELRVPFLQLHGNIDGFGSRDIGDLTVVTKYALINDRTTGNVFSVGLAVTAPTGREIPTIDGNLHSTLLQPWCGYIWNRDRFFVHAFHSVVVPTDTRDVTLLFNDVGLNYWLYRGEPNRLLTFVVPMAEVHVTTPLDHRDANSGIFVPDAVVFTGGVHLGVGRNATLSFGAATPITGPRPYNIEGFLQFNVRF